MAKRKVVLLGSTGSIGTSTLKVAAEIPERMEIIALAANSSVESLARQARDTGVKHVALYDASKESELRAALPGDVTIHLGAEGLLEVSTLADADMVLVAIVGTAGLQPALAAIDAGKDIAVASKEILVMAGELVMNAAAEKGVHVLPVDSEHNAIYQCLHGHQGGEKEVSRLILTASGGPFRNTPAEDLEKVTVEQALNHPTWDMGRKITIDSSTLFNKGLEMIEARWLFGIEMDRIDVIVHPQSIVHSMVEYVDGSVLAQLSNTDMCFPIQYAVTWPDRVTGGMEPLDFAKLAKLEFEEPRYDVFPALNLARRAGDTGGTMPAVYNAANEVAVDAFCDGQIGYTDIWKTVEKVMDIHRVQSASDLGQLLQADLGARSEAQAICAV
ncbi:MAG: 1-deoxy-D-xylulose-5-phosphate reductoisomerase [Verrucomicrobiae bacterium]|nr:1-deoxy-D-xylulose-5-phosphate reductoisomerase [Verrucomicrobiae bacterium]NNJ87753.1 1-deoxy-D-xylulose-5-phosphate reductoisomerase [Akkermansiaceae bacterium]